MSDQPENVVLVYLRRLDTKMDQVIAELRDLKGRVSSLEIADLYSSYAGVQVRLDHIDTRLDRIERRLDLVEPVQ